MDGLKLFVVGEESGNPVDWGAIGTRIFVYARAAPEAESMTEFGGPVAEVSPIAPMILCRYEDHGNPE